MKRNGMCPICFLKNLLFGAKKVAKVPAVPPYENGIKKTPLMGWSSWNTFRGNINENLIFETAQAMVDKGLRDAGYNYVNVDDCWQSNERDLNGELQGDLITFSSGINSLVKKINDLGLKLGLYSSNGTLTCEDLPASLYKEKKDALTLARWGVEYFKYDYCHNEKISEYAPLVYGITFAPFGGGESTFINCSNGIVEGLARFMPCAKIEGKRVVSGLDRGVGSIIFKNVYAKKAGKYVLSINIKKRGKYEKYLIAEVNGKDYEIFFPPQKRYNVVAKFQTVVEFDEGFNTIKLFNPIALKQDSTIMQYRRMANALKEASQKVADEKNLPVKPILFSICEWGFNKPYKWGKTAGNMWRTTPDIRPFWFWIKAIYEHNVKLFKYSSAGHFNDPDMLEVGNGKLTYNQNLSHFALWCFMNAPLVLGNDIRQMSDKVKQIVTNKELIAINQDNLCKQAKRIKRGKVDILAKPLSDGLAICFFNKFGGKSKAKFNLEKLKSDNYFSKVGNDLNVILGEAKIKKTIIEAKILRHGVTVVKIK